VKGLTHLTVGVAWASCWPQVVTAGAAGHPGLFVLAAACGILPDTLDFRFLRYLYPYEMEIIPDPKQPDPGLIASAMAHAVTRVVETGRPVRIRLNTVRVGSGLWQQYRLRFDVAAQQVQVDYTGVVNTSREPAAGSIGSPPCSRRAKLPCAVALDYRAETDIDIFDGPTFRLEPLPDGRVRARFIPWHRQWTHSLVIAATVGLVAAAIGGIIAGVVAGGAWALHVIADQAGFLGSNLFYPFTRDRTPGRQIAEADHPWVNVVMIWLSGLVVLGNLARQAEPPGLGVSLPALLLLGGLLPLGTAALASRWLNRHG